MTISRALLATLTAAMLSQAAFASPQLAAHRAVYEIDLDDASERSGIKGMSGRMVYDFGGSLCDGFTTSFRFVTRIETDDVSRLTDQQTTTFEDVEDGIFQFATRSFVDEQQDRDVKGIASEADGRLSVELTSPEARNIELPGTSFPTQHLLDLLTAAEGGETLFERALFDGSEDADKTLETTAVIGAPKVHEDEGDGDVLPVEFEGLRYWPVTIAYYGEEDGEPKGGEATPLYRIEMKLYENGVTRDIAMDYGEFQLSGTLSDIEIREADSCN